MLADRQDCNKRANQLDRKLDLCMISTDGEQRKMNTRQIAVSIHWNTVGCNEVRDGIADIARYCRQQEAHLCTAIGFGPKEYYERSLTIYSSYWKSKRPVISDTIPAKGKKAYADACGALFAKLAVGRYC